MAKFVSATIDDLLKQAKTTNRLLAAQLKSQMSQMDLVKLLATTGLTAREIADVLDTTAPTVAVTLQRLRQKKAKKTEGDAAGVTSESVGASQRLKPKTFVHRKE